MVKKKKKKVIEIKHHVLIPKHLKTSEKEKKMLLEKYNITLRELPKIQITDPAIQKLDVKPGDIVKVVRYTKVTGETVYYRGVINA